MKIVCALFRYFPYGGLSRDMMKIADALVSHGHQVTICAERWDGEVPRSHHVRLFSSKKMTNHGRARSFVRFLKDYIDAEQPDIVIGFNRMPYLDVYFAADVCYADIVEQHHGLSGLLYKMTPRSRTYLDYERAVFGPNSKTRILFLDEHQRKEYEKFYKVEESRCLMLPPGISPNCRYGRYSKEELTQCRHAWGVADHDFLFLQVGSDFKRKGVDRSIRSIADLPEDIRRNCKLVVVGKDEETPFLALAAELKIKQNVIFTHGIPDASMLIAAADVLIHPARCENTGTVIVEALATGTPVIATATCGFSHYVKESQGGIVIADPDDRAFKQEELNEAVYCFVTDILFRNFYIGVATRFARNLSVPNMQQLVVNFIFNTF